MGVSELKLWLSKDLSDDLGVISKFHNVPERDWLLKAIAQLVKDERVKAEEGFERLYVHGLIDDVSFTELLGRVPADKLKAQREIQVPNHYKSPEHT
jgi:hypothetical protein